MLQLSREEAGSSPAFSWCSWLARRLNQRRRKLGTCGDYLETVRGVGYRFKDLEHE
jgi:DNA-binding winged helix-turn-helix (wHTH) protein